MVKEQKNVYEFIKIFKQQKNSSYIIEHVGTWRETDKFISKMPSITLENRRNLAQINFNVAFGISENQTLEHLTDYR